MVLARSAVRRGRMPQRWLQAGATTGRSWHSGRQPDCRARHPDWHIRLLRDRAGGLAKRLQHLAQGPHAGRGSTALPRSAAHGCLGLPKAQPPPRPPVSRTVVSSQSGRPTRTAPVCPHTARALGGLGRQACLLALEPRDPRLIKPVTCAVAPERGQSIPKGMQAFTRLMVYLSACLYATSHSPSYRRPIPQ
jgi:hypothetical protein